LIAPSYSTATSVVTAMQTLAAKCRALALIDAPAATTVANAIAGRNPGGGINFFTSSGRIVCCYPLVKHDNGVAVVSEFLSSYAAGIVARVDDAEGYWHSPSNHAINGVAALERALIGGLRDPNSETQQLNDAGIVTVNVVGSSGFLLWGNYTAAYPSDTSPLSFIVVRRVIDVLEDALETSSLPFIDQPINSALIDGILQSYNAFIGNEIRKGALLPGSVCTYDPASNPSQEVAAGHLTFDLAVAPATPSQTITIRTTLSIDLYALKAAA
jgi:phage tail sheath protein FI